MEISDWVHAWVNSPLQRFMAFPDMEIRSPLKAFRLKKDTVSGSWYLLLHYQGVTGNLKSDGIPSCFEIRFGKKIRLSHVISKILTDPKDAAGLRLYLSALPEEPVSLVCGARTTPHMSITDSLDMPIPAFGPLELILIS